MGPKRSYYNNCVNRDHIKRLPLYYVRQQHMVEIVERQSSMVRCVFWDDFV